MKYSLNYKNFIMKRVKHPKTRQDRRLVNLSKRRRLMKRTVEYPVNLDLIKSQIELLLRNFSAINDNEEVTELKFDMKKLKDNIVPVTVKLQETRAEEPSAF